MNVFKSLNQVIFDPKNNTFFLFCFRPIRSTAAVEAGPSHVAPEEGSARTRGWLPNRSVGDPRTSTERSHNW